MNELEPIPDAEISRLVTDRLATLERLAKQHADEQARANTKRAHEDDWKHWTRFTRGLGIPELSNTLGALVAFVVYLERQHLAPTTIDRRLAGAVVGLRARGAEPSKADTEAARKALNGYMYRLAEAGETRGRGKAPAMTLKYIRAMVTHCPDTVTGARDKALILVAFGIAARRSEVANLLVSDLTRTDEGLTVHVRYGKAGARKPAIPAVPGSPTCPVAAWDEWLELSGITDGPAFRRIHRSGRILGGMSPQAAGHIISRASARANLAVRLTGHSARAGLATEARRAGHDKVTIADQGGWARNSAALEGYFREVDQWSNNPLKGIGL